jgi:hypothetical protein
MYRKHFFSLYSCPHNYPWPLAVSFYTQVLTLHNAHWHLLTTYLPEILIASKVTHLHLHTNKQSHSVPTYHLYMTSLNPVPNEQVCVYLLVHITKLHLQTTFPKPLYIPHFTCIHGDPGRSKS